MAEQENEIITPEADLEEMQEGVVEVKTKRGSVKAKWWTLIAIIASIAAAIVIIMYAAAGSGFIEVFKK